MSIDLKSMSKKQLEKHLKDVEKALADLREMEKREAKKAAEKAAAQFGFSLSELTGNATRSGKPLNSKRKAPKNPSAPKYANPHDKSQTWTGKGRQPNWYRAAIRSGITPEMMSI